MASFQAKICRERTRKKERKKKSVRWVPTQPVIENSKKIAKKLKKLKNTIMTSFQAKISWEKQRKREKKSFQQVPTWPEIENSKKIVKKLKKLENTIMGSFRAKICRGRPRKGEKKNRSDEFLPYS